MILNKIIKFIIIILIFVTLHIVYKSEIVWNGELRSYYFKYLVLISLFIFLLFIFLLFNNEVKKYFVIFTLSIIFTFYSFEAYLIIIELTHHKKILNEKTIKYKEKTNKNFDKRSLNQIYNDQIKINKNIKLTIEPSLFLKYELLDIFPLSGISNSQTINCNENGSYSYFKSDRYGFNNPDDQWSKKKFNYVLVGDSYVFGSCVNRPFDIASSLRRLSNKTALNLGYGGNGPLIQYATLKEYLPDNTENVLWFYFEGNDHIDLLYESKNAYLNNYLKDINYSQKLINRQDEVDIMLNIFFKKIEQVHLEKEKQKKLDIVYQFVKLFKLRSAILSNKIELNEKLYTKVLSKAKKLADKNGSNFYFVYLPQFKRFEGQGIEYNNLISITKKLDITFIDINKIVFGSDLKPKKLFPFGLDGHYTKEGYYRIAEAINNHLQNKFD